VALGDEIAQGGGLPRPALTVLRASARLRPTAPPGRFASPPESAISRSWRRWCAPKIVPPQRRIADRVSGVCSASSTPCSHQTGFCPLSSSAAQAQRCRAPAGRRVRRMGSARRGRHRQQPRRERAQEARRVCMKKQRIVSILNTPFATHIVIRSRGRIRADGLGTAARAFRSGAGASLPCVCALSPSCASRPMLRVPACAPQEWGRGHHW
jgi:hypothetical protein